MLDDSLKELVRSSQTIVIAAPESPPWHKRDINFDNDAPPYKQTIFHYRAIKTLFGDVSPGSFIEVIEADTGIHQEEHYAYHVKNMTMCIAWTYYTQKYEVKDEEPRILFLQKDKAYFVHVNHTGYEGVEAEAEVLSLLEERSWLNYGEVGDWSF